MHCGVDAVSTNLARVDSSLLGTGHDVSFAANEETVGEGLVRHGLVALDNICDDLHLGSGELQCAKQNVSKAKVSKVLETTRLDVR